VVKCNVFLIAVHGRHGFVAAFTSRTDAVMQVKEGETVALLGATKSVNSMGFQHNIFETDRKLFTDAILGSYCDISEFGLWSIVLDIKHFLSINFNFMVKFIPQQTNMVAHTLAREVIALVKKRNKNIWFIYEVKDSVLTLNQID